MVVKWNLLLWVEFNLFYPVLFEDSARSLILLPSVFDLSLSVQALQEFAITAVKYEWQVIDFKSSVFFFIFNLF